MQIEALETFLTIAEAGHFNKASDILCVTHSTVSARIQMLEDSLGQRLFNRSRSAATLTRAGTLFLPYAQAVVRNWRKARQEIALPSGFTGIVSIATSLWAWQEIVLPALPNLQKAAPKLALKLKVTDSATAITALNAAEVDVVISHEAAPKVGWKATKLRDTQLLLLSTTPRELVRWHPQYVFVEWGAKFAEEHFMAFPVNETPIVTFSDGAAALAYILQFGGSAYLPKRALRDYPGRLHAVPHAPAFKLRAYAISDPRISGDNERHSMIGALIEGLLECT